MARVLNIKKVGSSITININEWITAQLYEVLSVGWLAILRSSGTSCEYINSASLTNNKG